ncbi:MAG: hypothetical protein J2O46_01780 [Nocardioides sp.]|nr:hypothetical protein [Nocardioides sp.]
MADELERNDLEAGLSARRELGDAYDRAMVEGFADRIERTVQERVGAARAQTSGLARVERRESTYQFVLGVVSAGVAIPISIPLGVTDHIGALVVSWIGLVGVNAAHAWSRRRGR